MNQADTRLNFFRQSGWMMASNVLCGACMAAANIAAQGISPNADYSVYVAILRVFVIFSLPGAALQTLLAQQTAGALSESSQRDLSATIRGVLKITFGFWFVLTIIAAIFRTQIAAMLQFPNVSLVWPMMSLILGNLLLPIFLGLLQGQQFFFTYGWATILNGVGRLGIIVLGITVFSIGVNGATYGAFAGLLIATGLAAWSSRSIFRPAPGHFVISAFLKKVLILTAGAGSTLFLISVDMPLVQSHFPKEIVGAYTPVAVIANALVLLCVPVAAVMFPKIVRSRATSSSSDALNLAVMGTVVIGGAAAIVCTLFPELPLRILAPARISSAPLVPWFLWAMVPVTVYNVLINNLMARERYAVIPWITILSVAYPLTLYFFLQRTHLPPFSAFKGVTQILMGYSTTMMLIAAYFTYLFSGSSSAEAGGANRSQTTGAKP